MAASEQQAADNGLGQFRPVRLRKAADVVADILVDAIRGGLYAPGDRLPRERDLAAKLEVSRTTLREATSILQRAGIVTVKRGSGGGVVIMSRVIPPDLLATGDAPVSRNAELRSLLEVRRALEMVACMLATRRATPGEIDEIRRLVEQLDLLVEHSAEFVRLDHQIHLQVVTLSHNPPMVRMLGEILNQQAAIRAEYPVQTFDIAEATRLHHEMVAALIDRDEHRALAVLDRHLADVEEHILGERLEPSFVVHSVGAAQGMSVAGGLGS